MKKLLCAALLWSAIYAHGQTPSSNPMLKFCAAKYQTLVDSAWAAYFVQTDANNQKAVDSLFTLANMVGGATTFIRNNMPGAYTVFCTSTNLQMVDNVNMTLFSKGWLGAQPAPVITINPKDEASVEQSLTLVITQLATAIGTKP